MTICIGALCDNGKGVVVATDRMLTNQILSVEFEHPAAKITQLTPTCVALTAGNAIAHTELLRSVQERVSFHKGPLVSQVADIVKQCYQEARKRQVIDRILTRRGFMSLEDYYERHRMLDGTVVRAVEYEMESYDYGVDLLVAGVDATGAHLYSVTDPGTSWCFDAVGYHAIGSGLPHAINTLIARGCYQVASMPEVLYMVYEAKRAAEKAPGVGATATDVAVVDENGTQKLTETQIATIKAMTEKSRPPSVDTARILAILSGASKPKDQENEAAVTTHTEPAKS